MATTKFNNNILEAARRLKDPRTDPSSNGDAGRRFTSANLTRYQNKAVRDFLREQFLQLRDAFGEVFPEYMRTSGGLLLVAGTVPKPVDAMVIIDLDKSDYLLHFHKLADREVQTVRGGASGLIVPSITRPVFWEENGNIYALPAGVGGYTVIARYVKTHQDLAVSTAAIGNGNFNTVAGQWTAATRRLDAVMNVNYANSDVNKKVMFRSATITYFGIIESRVSDSIVVLSPGTGLPVADIGAGLVLQVMVSDVDPDQTDLQLNESWHPEIVDRMTAIAHADAMET